MTVLHNAKRVNRHSVSFNEGIRHECCDVAAVVAKV